MKVAIRDIQALKSLRPLDIATYLRSKGWNESNFQASLSSTWLIRHNSEEFEILLPLNNNTPDYALRISEVLKTLELVEHRSQFEIFKTIQTTSTDIIRLHLDVPDLEGSLPIEKGVEVIQNTWDMMMAAACSVISPRQIFQSRKPNQAIEYMKKVRLGQTEQGSYVFTVLSPVSPELNLGQTRLFELTAPEIPFERKVTTTLLTGLTEMKSAAERHAVQGTFDNFESAVDHGVSANLCDSIAKLSNFDDQYKDLDINFSWSITRPIIQSIPSSVHLSSDLMPVFEEVARVFKENAPRDEFEVIGPVVKLDRPEGALTGKVTIWAPVDGLLKKIQIELPGDLYHIAVTAHDQDSKVSCYGKLIRERGRYILLNPREFTIEADP